jgi:ariadne-1
MNDDDAYNDDFRVPSPKGKRKLYEVEHESLSVEAIEDVIRKEADHVMGIFGVDVCRCSHYPLSRWSQSSCS